MSGFDRPYVVIAQWSKLVQLQEPAGVPTVPVVLPVLELPAFQPMLVWKHVALGDARVKLNRTVCDTAVEPVLVPEKVKLPVKAAHGPDAITVLAASLPVAV